MKATGRTDDSCVRPPHLCDARKHATGWWLSTGGQIAVASWVEAQDDHRVPLPISRSQLDRLGERLAAGSATPADLRVLEDVLVAYDEVITLALEIVEPLGFHPTSRLKTSGTLIENCSESRA